MTARLVQIWRHPIKSHGREALDHVTLTAGATMPWDRRWAVAHEGAKADNGAWAPCANFSRGAKAPALMAITTQSDEAAGTVTLRHPDRPDLSFDPDGDPAEFLAWVAPLMPADRAASTRIVRVPGRGMTDSSYPSLTIYNMASHRAVEQKMGRALSPNRWRGNLWLDGLDPWVEFDWLDKEIRIGDVVFAPRERVGRCLATTANTETGVRDADTLGVLKTWGHTHFGVKAEVVRGGTLHLGDSVYLP